MIEIAIGVFIGLILLAFIGLIFELAWTLVRWTFSVALVLAGLAITAFLVYAALREFGLEDFLAPALIGVILLGGGITSFFDSKDAVPLSVRAGRLLRKLLGKSNVNAAEKPEVQKRDAG